MNQRRGAFLDVTGPASLNHILSRPYRGRKWSCYVDDMLISIGVNTAALKNPCVAWGRRLPPSAANGSRFLPRATMPIPGGQAAAHSLHQDAAFTAPRRCVTESYGARMGYQPRSMWRDGRE